MNIVKFLLEELKDRNFVSKNIKDPKVTDDTVETSKDLVQADLEGLTDEALYEFCEKRGLKPVAETLVNMFTAKKNYIAFQKYVNDCNNGTADYLKSSGDMLANSEGTLFELFKEYGFKDEVIKAVYGIKPQRVGSGETMLKLFLSDIDETKKMPGDVHVNVNGKIVDIEVKGANGVLRGAKSQEYKKDKGFHITTFKKLPRNKKMLVKKYVDEVNNKTGSLGGSHRTSNFFKFLCENVFIKKDGTLDIDLLAEYIIYATKTQYGVGETYNGEADLKNFIVDSFKDIFGGTDLSKIKNENELIRKYDQINRMLAFVFLNVYQWSEGWTYFLLIGEGNLRYIMIDGSDPGKLISGIQLMYNNKKVSITSPSDLGDHVWYSLKYNA